MNAVRLFNGPVESGLRALVLLVEAFPNTLDMQRMVALDHLLVHSGDLEGGPESLHPPSPLRAGEVAVRRAVMQDGLHLFQVRGLIARRLSDTGFDYIAEDCACAFLDALASKHVIEMRARAEWLFASVGSLHTHALGQVLESSLSRWRAEFVTLDAEGTLDDR